MKNILKILAILMITFSTNLTCSSFEDLKNSTKTKIKESYNKAVKYCKDNPKKTTAATAYTLLALTSYCAINHQNNYPEASQVKKGLASTITPFYLLANVICYFSGIIEVRSEALMNEILKK